MTQMHQIRNRPICRPEDLIHDEVMLEQLRWLGNLAVPWLTVEPTPPDGFRCQFYDGKIPFDVGVASVRSPNEATSLYAVSRWLRGQPRICRPTTEQSEALAEVEINLELKDYSQPFEAVCVETPYAPFRAVVCCQPSPDVLILNVIGDFTAGDVGVCLRQEEGRTIESFLALMDPDLDPYKAAVIASERLALNMMLALSNFGCKSQPAYPKAQAADESLSKRTDEVGKRAARRVLLALQEVSFANTVVIRKPSRPPEVGDSVPTGRTTRPHWVRGHWKMAACGVGFSERRPVLVRPYLTHAEMGISPVRPTVYVDKR